MTLTEYLPRQRVVHPQARTRELAELFSPGPFSYTATLCRQDLDVFTLYAHNLLRAIHDSEQLQRHRLDGMKVGLLGGNSHREGVLAYELSRAVNTVSKFGGIPLCLTSSQEAVVRGVDVVVREDDQPVDPRGKTGEPAIALSSKTGERAVNVLGDYLYLFSQVEDGYGVKFHGSLRHDIGACPTVRLLAMQGVDAQYVGQKYLNLSPVQRHNLGLSEEWYREEDKKARSLSSSMNNTSARWNVVYLSPFNRHMYGAEYGAILASLNGGLEESLEGDAEWLRLHPETKVLFGGEFPAGSVPDTEYWRARLSNSEQILCREIALVTLLGMAAESTKQTK